MSLPGGLIALLSVRMHSVQSSTPRHLWALFFLQPSLCNYCALYLVAPSHVPSTRPTALARSIVPTFVASETPFIGESEFPSLEPTDTTTIAKSNLPSSEPAETPTIAESDVPTFEQTDTPAIAASNVPLSKPTDTSTIGESDGPTSEPTNTPSSAESYVSAWSAGKRVWFECSRSAIMSLRFSTQVCAAKILESTACETLSCHGEFLHSALSKRLESNETAVLSCHGEFLNKCALLLKLESNAVEALSCHSEILHESALSPGRRVAIIPQRCFSCHVCR